MAKHHLHKASFFSFIAHLLNIRRSSFSSSFSSSSSSNSSSSRCHDDAFESFHQTLAHRLTRLLPIEAATLGNMASLRCLLDLLLDTEWDLRKLQPDLNHSHPLSHSHDETMSGFFFDECVKLLDACNVIREAVWEVQQWSKLLRLAFASLDQRGPASLSRARKALADLMCLMDLDRKKKKTTGKKKVKKMTEGYTRGSSLLRNRNCRHASRAIAELHAMYSGLSAERYGRCIEESPAAAAVYALSFVSAFSLATILSVFRAPFGGGPAITNSRPLPNFPWSAPLMAMQGKAAKGAKMMRRSRGRKGADRTLSELDCIAVNVRDLYNATANDDGDHETPSSRRGEIRRMVKQLQEQVEGLEKNLSPLDAQVTELHKCLLEMHTRSLDLQSQGKYGSDS